MSDDQGQGPLEPRPGEDRIADFFARERAAITDLPVDDEHWRALVARSRRPRHWPAYLGGAAAAAAAAVIATTVLTAPEDPPADSATSASSPTVSRQTTPSTVSTATPTTDATTEKRFPVPRTFVLSSLSNAGGGRVYGLGEARCSGSPCAAVIGSTDNGLTWFTQATFTDLPLVRDTSSSATPALQGIRFASPEVGFVYGTVMRRTTDGGRTWQSYEYGGGRVLSVETDRASVWITAAEGCTLQACAGPVRVLRSAVSQAGADAVALTVPGHGAEDLSTSWVSLDGSTAYLNTFAEDEGPQRVSGTPGELPRPDGCPAGRPMSVVPTADAHATLFAICATAPRDSDADGYLVASSADGGQTWTTRASQAAELGPVRHNGPWVAATDSTHLVAATGGAVNASGDVNEPSSLVYSDDGGRTWQPSREASGGQLVGGSWGWLGTPGGSTVYALGPGGGYLSNDHGATFSPIDLR